MKYTAKITVEGDSKNIFKLFHPEIKEFQNNRASYTLKEKDGEVEFLIKATDASALRAVMNSVIKNLVVYEKAK